MSARIELPIHEPVEGGVFAIEASLAEIAESKPGPVEGTRTLTIEHEGGGLSAYDVAVTQGVIDLAASILGDLGDPDGAVVRIELPGVNVRPSGDGLG